MPFSKMMFLMLLTESFDTKKWSIWVMWFSSVMRFEGHFVFTGLVC